MSFYFCPKMILRVLLLRIFTIISIKVENNNDLQKLLYLTLNFIFFNYYSIFIDMKMKIERA